MNDLEEINRAINRALRALNDVAVRIPLSSISNHDVALDEITRALTHVDNLQRKIFAANPDLEYHFDESRPPTRAMKEVSDLVAAADQHMKQSNVSAAEDALRRARDLEPPPLAYEVIEKRLNDLRRPR